MAARGFTATEKRLLAHLDAAGATVNKSWVSPDRNLFVVRYSVGGHDRTLVVSHVAADVLDNWSDYDFDGMLHSYRVVEGASKLEEDAVFFVRASDGPAGTYKERGIIVVAMPKGDLGLA
jgi:hypothetical protein